MTSVYKCINAVQAAMAKTGIAKDRRNSQGAGYMFRGIDDVYNAIAPLLAEHGLVIIPRMLTRTCEERQSKAGGALFYVTVEAEFDFVSAEDGSKATARTFGEAMDSGDKATNKAMSAAYKYACFQTFAIPTEGDNDADGHTHEVSATAAKELREKWLIAQKGAIANAATVGDLKRILEAAITVTRAEGDQDAEDQLNAAAEAKKSKAKAKIPANVETADVPF
jgi:hypothetical protein